jgi:ElaB/YqjD/DUF883 family membrane-anchored ribosome-binding protein
MPPSQEYLRELKEWGTKKQNMLDFLQMYRTMSQGAESAIDTAEEVLREENRSKNKDAARIRLYKKRLSTAEKDLKSYEKKIKAGIKQLVKHNNNKPQP